MIAPAALEQLRAGVVVDCLPDRSGFVIALPETGPGLACPVCARGAMGVCVVRQRIADGMLLEAELTCLHCAHPGELAA